MWTTNTWRKKYRISERPVGLVSKSRRNRDRETNKKGQIPNAGGSCGFSPNQQFVIPDLDAVCLKAARRAKMWTPAKNSVLSWPIGCHIDQREWMATAAFITGCNKQWKLLKNCNNCVEDWCSGNAVACLWRYTVQLLAGSKSFFVVFSFFKQIPG